MTTVEELSELKRRAQEVRITGVTFFKQVEDRLEGGQEYFEGRLWETGLSRSLREEGNAVRAKIKDLSIDIAGKARGSPLVAEADLQDLRQNTKRMLAAIRFREFRHWGVVVHYDEDIVLGVDPPSQQEDPIDDVDKAKTIFNEAATAVLELVDLIAPGEIAGRSRSQTQATRYRPNTAFILMQIDRTQPGLEDIRDAIKEVCKRFGIAATVADEIEHEGGITERLLEEIETSEFIIADLTGERPNVYYEIGYAHGRNKRVILYRREETKLHFDIAHRNCPTYKNVTDLKRQLTQRMASITNRPVPETSYE